MMTNKEKEQRARSRYFMIVFILFGSVGAYMYYSKPSTAGMRMHKSAIATLSPLST